MTEFNGRNEIKIIIEEKYLPHPIIINILSVNSPASGLTTNKNKYSPGKEKKWEHIFYKQPVRTNDVLKKFYLQ